MRKFLQLFLVVLLVFTIVIPTVSPEKAIAASEIENAKTIQMDELLLAEFSEGESVHWYSFTPSKENIHNFSHVSFNLNSTEEVNISVYSDMDKALMDQTFDRYVSYAYLEEPAIIDFPIAWIGTYYIKVETHDDSSYYENGISYELSAAGSVLPPDDGSGYNCPAEVTMTHEIDGEEVLKDLRTIRSNLLSQTDSGKELTKVYYQAAPYISANVLLNKDNRVKILDAVKELKPLISSISKDQKESNYVLSAGDQAAIQTLYNMSLEIVPENVATNIRNTTQSIDFEELEGLAVVELLTDTGFLNEKEDISGKLIIKLKEDQSMKSFSDKITGFNMESVTADLKDHKITEDTFVIDLADQSQFKAQDVAKKIEALPEVEYVEPVKEYYALTSDVYYDDQWSLKNKAEESGKINADIQYEGLLEHLKQKQLPDKIVAVLDTGVDHTLADLRENVLVAKGFNMIDENTNAIDNHGHGTHVAGVIAADNNNGYSMAGINQSVKIMPVKVLNDEGRGTNEQVARGIKYAVDNGAHVINMSLGSSEASKVIEDALIYAKEKGVTVVAASGNDGEALLSYPGSSHYTISVGATDSYDQVSDYSNYGVGLDVVAPGTQIPSLVPDGNVTYFNGTSMATPHVAAIAAYLLSANEELTPEQVKSILTKKTKDLVYNVEDPIDENGGSHPAEMLESGYDFVSGWGRLDGFAAVSYTGKKESLAVRVSGNTRYDTSVALSESGWVSSEVAVIATGKNYPDALSATPLAYKYDAPLLLTAPDQLSESVLNELSRLNVSKVILIGGESVISNQVVNDIKQLPAISQVERISGKDRYETSINIAKKLDKQGSFVLATGQSFADALSIAPVAGQLGMPILLTRDKEIPANVASFISNEGFTSSYIVGGENAITEKSVAKLPGKKRLSGTDRYETNANIIKHFESKLDMSTQFISTGSNYPDALAGSSYASMNKNPLILTHPTRMKQSTKDVINHHAGKAKGYYVIGGENAISSEEISKLLK
ncbi:hypothetical protein JMA_28550 [Jeotgalibacillus malaysiensis]|uniref:Peptidase S8/S53 domain-containing protein n=1 Tax=Jeotgalibacillus malaysiensis TaxID=1508404 RepID=A0A0B5ATX8_9BACL|nr:cell wall-binding repeat-containing protein [Jeotgalibacillus malaysiensis]AJD92172.1 hypothetical protein JMA_28550 [Jeotgalibacillus malaysiensis]